MQLQIILPKDAPKQGIIILKGFIEKESINGLKSAEIDREQHKQGQMGDGNILNSITTIIEAAAEPLVALIKCLQKYVENFRTTITVPTKNGPIVISHGRSMKPEQLEKIVVSIQQNDL